MLVKQETYRRGIVLSTLLNVVSKGIVFINLILIAYFFGSGLEVDLYFYYYNLVFLIVTYLSSINTTVLIPEAMRMRVHEGEQASMGFLNLFLGIYLGLILLFSVIFLIDPVASFSLVSKYDEPALRRNIELLYLVIPLLVLMGMTTLITDILVSYRFFTMPVLVACINGLATLLFMVVFSRQLHIKSALLGLNAAYIMNLCLLLYSFKKHLHWNFGYRVKGIRKKIFGDIGFSQVGNLASFLGSYAPIYFFSGWPAGVVSALYYAQQVSNQPTTFITNQFSIVARIKLNELFVNQQLKETNANFLSSLKFLIFILTPISGLIFLFAKDIVTVIFSHGSFDQSSAELCAQFLRYLSVTSPLIAINNMTGNLFFVAQRLRFLTTYQVIINVIMIALVYTFIRQFGTIGYPVAFFLTYALNAVILARYGKKYFPHVEFEKVLIYIATIFFVNILVMALIWFIFFQLTSMPSVFRMIIGSAAYVIILVLLNEPFKINRDFSSILVGFYNRFKKIGKSETE